MKKITIFKSMFGRIVSIPILFYMVTLVACSKQAEDIIPIPPAPPPENKPSGVIQSFVLTDTLVAFNKGSTAKWLVNGTNSLTVVTFNGVKVATVGVLDTGPLKQASLFTLAVNNGKQASVTLKVADSLTSLLWNKGKRLKLIKTEVNIIPAGQTELKWIDTLIPAQVADQRIFFNLDGSSKLFQLSSIYPTPNNPGRFAVTVTATQTVFTWQGIIFTVIFLDSNTLIVTYYATQPFGNKLLTRNTYQYE